MLHWLYARRGVEDAGILVTVVTKCPEVKFPRYLTYTRYMPLDVYETQPGRPVDHFASAMLVPSRSHKIQLQEKRLAVPMFNATEYSIENAPHPAYNFLIHMGLQRGSYIPRLHPRSK